MTRMAFGFFRNPLHQTMRHTAQHVASATLGAYWGLNLLKLENEKKQADLNDTFSPDWMISTELLLNLITPSTNRYPYLDEEKRAEIFDVFFNHIKANDDTPRMEMLLAQAIQSNQFIAINAIISRAEHLAQPQLFEQIEQAFPTLSYQMIKLHSENRLAKPFQTAFFSCLSGTKTPRVFYHHANLSKEITEYIVAIKNTNETTLPRRILFHDGNMTYNQTIISATFHEGQLTFEMNNHSAFVENIFCEAVKRTLGETKKLSP